MKINRFDYFDVKSQKDLDANAAGLREGLAGLTCIFIGKIESVAGYIGQDKELVFEDEYISGIEVYDNGAMNIFIRYPEANTVHAFLRVRPE